MPKRTTARPVFTHDSNPSTRAARAAWSPRDPVVAYLVMRLGENNPIFVPVMAEMARLLRRGVTITNEIVDRVIDAASAPIPAHPDIRPIAVMPYGRDLPRKRERGRPSGPFVHVDVSGEVVYYMRIGDRVKIGTTVNLRRRLKVINPEELLAVEAGGRALERRRHREFAELRTNGEWFRYEGPLLAHIVAVQAASPWPSLLAG